MKCTAFECSVQAKTRCPVPVAGGGAPSRSSDSHTTALRCGRGQRSAAHFARLRLYRHVRGEVWVGRYDTPSAQDRTGLKSDNRTDHESCTTSHRRTSDGKRALMVSEHTRHTATRPIRCHQVSCDPYVPRPSHASPRFRDSAQHPHMAGARRRGDPPGTHAS